MRHHRASHTSTASLPLLLLPLFGACAADEPLVTAGDACEARWTTEIDVGSTVWSRLGARAADHGRTTLVVWEGGDLELGHLASESTTNVFLQMALLESETGDVIRELARVVVPGELWGFELVATSAGFVLVTLEGPQGVGVTFISPTGEIISGSFLEELGGAMFEVPMVVDNEGVTFFTMNAVTRLGVTGEHIATAPLSPPSERQSFCTGATKMADGRVAAWCLILDREDEAPRLVVMGPDGSNQTASPIRAIDGRRDALLMSVDDELVAVFQHGGRTLAVVVGTDGDVRAGPTLVGAPPVNRHLVGSEVATGTAVGLRVAGLESGAVVGFETLPTSALEGFIGTERVTFSQLALDAGEIVVEELREQTAHAHDLDVTGRGVLSTWLDNSAFVLWPYDLPEQRLVIKHACAQ